MRQIARARALGARLQAHLVETRLAFKGIPQKARGFCSSFAARHALAHDWVRGGEFDEGKKRV